MFRNVIEIHFSTIKSHYLRGIEVLETFIQETPKNRLIFLVWTLAVKLEHFLNTNMLHDKTIRISP